MRASKAMQHRVNSKSNIVVKYNSEVVEVIGEMLLKELKLLIIKLKIEIIDITGFL